MLHTILPHEPNIWYIHTARANHVCKKCMMSATTNAASKPRGAFIVLEGLDRCGKTTQAALLAEHLAAANIAVEAVQFPSRSSAIGQLINTYLTTTSSSSCGGGESMSDEAVHLLFSANRWEQSASLAARLASGCTLVCDRYAHSGAAYSIAKLLDDGWCKACDIGLPAPDCIIYLDITPEDAARRGDFGGERYEKIDFQREVCGRFMDLKADNAYADDPIPWHVIDATESVGAVRAQIAAIAETVVASVQYTPINKLAW